MELVKILRELSRRKRLVAVVLGIALVTGFLLAFRPGIPPKSRQYKVALASVDILVDTRNSQVVAVSRHGPDLSTLASRADLIGNLMTSGPLKNGIARQAGIRPDDLVVVPPANASTPGVPPVPVKPSASRDIPDAEATILSLSTEETLPILHVSAQASSLQGARRLSAATISTLREYLGSVAGSQHIPASRQLVIRQFGAPLAEIATRGLPRRYALAATIVILLLGCGAIVGGSWFIRNWKLVEEAEGRGALDAEEPEPPTAGAQFSTAADPQDPGQVVRALGGRSGRA